MSYRCCLKVTRITESSSYFRSSSSVPLTGKPHNVPANVTRTPLPSGLAVPSPKVNGHVRPPRVAVPSAVQFNADPATVPVPEPLASTPAHVPLNATIPDLPSSLFVTV